MMTRFGCYVEAKGFTKYQVSYLAHRSATYFTIPEE